MQKIASSFTNILLERYFIFSPEGEYSARMLTLKYEFQAGQARTAEGADDLSHDIADNVIKNRHDHENVIHGTPCVDCHTTGPIGHGAVISGSEAKKIGEFILLGLHNGHGLRLLYGKRRN